MKDIYRKSSYLSDSGKGREKGTPKKYKKDHDLRKNGKVESESSQEETISSKLKSSSGHLHYESGLVMARRLMSNMIDEENLVDEMVCDEATHILLGRPCQFDRRATHDGVINRLSFEHMEHKVILKPLSPKEVCEDQIKMK
ncbi:hypothetical protein CR513_58378, partial [Mucuna pruriens]